MATEPEDAPIEPLGAPTDPLRPTGVVEAQEGIEETKARMAAKAGQVLKAVGIILAGILLLALVFFLVGVAVVPKPDL